MRSFIQRSVFRSSFLVAFGFAGALTPAWAQYTNLLAIHGGLATLSGTTFYGIGNSNSAYSGGSVSFKVNSNGSGYTNLHSFPGFSDSGGMGVLPTGPILIGTNLYGVTTSSVANLRVRVPASLGTNGSGPALLSGGRLRLTFGDAEGGAPTAADLANVEVQYATTLLGTNTVWTRLPAVFNATNGQWFVEDNAPGISARRYYRVIER